jgi:uncharacterized protein (DUF302 family)
MKTPRYIRRIVVCLCIFTPASAAGGEKGGSIGYDFYDAKETRRYSTEGQFNDVKAFLSAAIAERGLKISNISYISKMLQRTREALGSDKAIFRQAEAIEFCSAPLSRQMMEANPHNIVFCPYSILIYELAEQPGLVHLAYRRPFYLSQNKSDESLHKVDQLLNDIILEVIE